LPRSITSADNLREFFTPRSLAWFKTRSPDHVPSRSIPTTTSLASQVLAGCARAIALRQCGGPNMGAARPVARSLKAQVMLSLAPQRDITDY
jgi:hypothetical protein